MCIDLARGLAWAIVVVVAIVIVISIVIAIVVVIVIVIIKVIVIVIVNCHSNNNINTQRIMLDGRLIDGCAMCPCRAALPRGRSHKTGRQLIYKEISLPNLPGQHQAEHTPNGR